MVILNYLKLGAIGAAAAAIIFLAWNYQHRGRVIEAQRIQIEQLEAADRYYRAQPKIDEHTKEMTREVKRATEAGDVDRVKWLYEQLRMHKADQSKTTLSPRDGGTDE